MSDKNLEPPDVWERRMAMAESYVEVVRDLMVESIRAHRGGDLAEHQRLGDQANDLMGQLEVRDVALMVWVALAPQVVDILHGGDELGPPTPRCEWCKLPADGSLPLPEIRDLRELTR